MFSIGGSRARQQRAFVLFGRGKYGSDSRGLILSARHPLHLDTQQQGRPHWRPGQDWRRSGSTLTRLPRRNDGRERVVILGAGWGGYVLAQHLDARQYEPIIVAPRSYFAFTPLLASASVGRVELGAATESVRSRRSTSIGFCQGWADDVDFAYKTVTVEEAVRDPRGSGALTDARQGVTASARRDEGVVQEKQVKGRLFDVEYDKLVVAVGCYSQTFGTKGVKEHANFLKDVDDARRIKKRTLECFEICFLPTTSDTLKKQLLHFGIVGGGPTGIEFAAELYDLIHYDLVKIYPSLKPFIRMTVYDVAPNILSMFDQSLSTYVRKTIQREGIEIKTEHHVEELRKGVPEQLANDPEIREDAGVLTLKTKEDGETLSKGWRLPARSLNLPASATSDTSTHDWTLHPKAGEEGKTQATMKDVFALGDCAMLDGVSLPATAQVADQKAKWLAQRFNIDDLERHTFSFKDLGYTTYIGNMNAAVETGGKHEIKGRAAWILWRAAYISLALSWRNRILIPCYWFANWMFGRDLSRF